MKASFSALLFLAVGAQANTPPVKVWTYDALNAAVLNGDHKILVESDITFAAPIEIPAGKNIRIYAKGERKTLDGNGETQLFRVDGTLTLQHLVLAEGYATNGFCSYTQNSGEECGGGAVHVDVDAHLIVDGCAFRDSQARYGGAIYTYGGAVDVSGSTFTENGAYEAGGAVWTYAHVALSISNCEFTGNVAIKAGAVFTGGDATIADSTFSGNVATASEPSDDDHAGGFWGGEGGAIWVNEDTAGVGGAAACVVDGDNAIDWVVASPLAVHDYGYTDDAKVTFGVAGDADALPRRFWALSVGASRLGRGPQPLGAAPVDVAASREAAETETFDRTEPGDTAVASSAIVANVAAKWYPAYEGTDLYTNLASTVHFDVAVRRGVWKSNLQPDFNRRGHRLGDDAVLETLTFTHAKDDGTPAAATHAIVLDGVAPDVLAADAAALRAFATSCAAVLGASHLQVSGVTSTAYHYVAGDELWVESCPTLEALPEDSALCPDDLGRRAARRAAIGDLCEGDGECGTDKHLDNCGNADDKNADIYRVVADIYRGRRAASCPRRSSPRRRAARVARAVDAPAHGRRDQGRAPRRSTGPSRTPSASTALARRRRRRDQPSAPSPLDGEAVCCAAPDDDHHGAHHDPDDHESVHDAAAHHGAHPAPASSKKSSSSSDSSAVVAAAVAAIGLVIVLGAFAGYRVRRRSSPRETAHAGDVELGRRARPAAALGTFPKEHPERPDSRLFPIKQAHRETKSPLPERGDDLSAFQVVPRGAYIPCCF
ncbi:hypothetical protein JL720_14000 [Aureococcus anophagefferens]|nr:hypothetical protein JL720_14000 [Aureococcus anophagefferens]